MLDHLVVGAYPLDQSDVRMLSTLGIDLVFNLAEDEDYGEGDREIVEAALSHAGIQEHRLSFHDFGGLPATTLEAAVRQINAALDQGATIYLHCRAGWQRSAAVAAGVIAVREKLDIDEALSVVRHRKPSADPLPHQRDDLRRWWAGRSAPEASR